MREKKTAVTRVDPDRLDRWKEEIEESNQYNSIAQALRVGFEQLFNESEDNKRLSEELKRRMDEIEEEIKENREHIDRLSMKYPTEEEITDSIRKEIEFQEKLQTKYFPHDFDLTESKEQEDQEE